MPIPLFYFGLTVVDFHDRRPLLYTAYAMTGVAAISLLLQLLGFVALSSTMYLFQILLMVSLILFAALILYEGVRYKNQAARRFFLPILAIAIFCVLEWVNYQIRFTSIISVLFQIGVMIFVLVTGVIGGLLVRDALRVARQKQQLDFEVSLMETQMTEQKKQYVLFLENAQTVKAQRHDLRHQLAVIRNYSEEGDNRKLTDYLDTLIESIPDRQGEEYCENAVESCSRMPKNQRFIRLNSRLQYKTLTITMDNSFDGKVYRQGDRLLSSKRTDYGIGTASITSVAEKHGGGATFEANGAVFQSSVYVQV